jgi:hypothetical protein
MTPFATPLALHNPLALSLSKGAWDTENRASTSSALTEIF